MKNLFLIGGPFYMGILTILLIASTVWMIYHFMQAFNSNKTNLNEKLNKLRYGISIGLFALITGILAQLIGFYEAFSAIEKAGDISPALVYGAIKVSLITTIYGVFIYLFSLLLWLIFSLILEKRPFKQV